MQVLFYARTTGIFWQVYRPMKLRPVLFIAYNFPPHGGAGVQRSLKFVKYLPEFGWKPIVITTTADAGQVQDLTLLSDIPAGIPIHRFPAFSIARLQSQAARLKLDRLVVFLNLLLQIPDAAIFWSKKIRSPLVEIVEREKPKVVYTTSGPYSAHLVGLWAKQRFQIPWFADFRDPWSHNLIIPYLPGYRTLNRYLERRVLAAADRVSCVSRPWLEEMQDNSQGRPGKFLVLPNGYDDADIKPLRFPPDHRHFTLTHLGSFYRNRHPHQFLTAIETLMESGRIPLSEIKVIFVGKNAKNFIPDHPPFEVHDYIPHKELGEIRSRTTTFILILDVCPENIGNYSGKLYEYISANRPIIGIVPPGGVAQSLITETQTGLTVENNPSAIANAVANLYSAWKHRQWDWHPDWTVIRRYTRRRLTEQLSAQFEQLSRS